MTYLHPGRLWLLVVVVALAVTYGLVQRHRRTLLARYANPDLAHSPVPVTSRARRHVSPVLALVGLAALVVAVAQPTRSGAVARQQGVVVLAVDVSASMSATDVAPDRLEAAIASAASFVDEVPDSIHIGLVAFDKNARQVVEPTTDHDSVKAAIAALEAGPGTATGDGIEVSLDAIRATLSPELLASGADLPASVVLLSDGTPTVGTPVATATADATELGVPVTTIAFGTPDGTVTIQGETFRVPADPETMRAVADATGGSFFEATSAGQLADVYQDISTVVGTTTEQREVTRGVLGLALAALLASAALGIAWGGRAI